MAAELPFTALVSGLPATIPFIGPEALERQSGREFTARIGANESAFGVSPEAAAAMRDAIEHVSWYADPEAFDLRTALATRHGVRLEEICLGAGIDELLGLVVRMVVSAGTPVVTSHGGYPTFNYHVAGYGGSLHTVPYTNDHNDLDGLADKVLACDAPLVYLANPDNPMGTWHDASAIGAFIRRLPESTLFILDEAYIDFAPDGVECPIDTARRNVLHMRTFSKAHGMAGARIGYVVANKEVCTALNKIRNHFGMSRIAQAGALASLHSTRFLQQVCESVADGRRDYYALAQSLGLASIPSATNFVAIDVGGGERARRLLTELGKRGVFVRMPGVEPLDRCIRASVGTAAQRQTFANAFREILEAEE